LVTGTPKIVVVTPVKNEAWILDRFLTVTSQFADHIIIADQLSTDGSLEIYPKYPKVHVIMNDSGAYDESSRQLLLLNEARNVVPTPRIILGLDADEILAADAVQKPGWQAMLAAKPGTVVWFEKPDLYGSTEQCIRHSSLTPLGYVDDGAVHRPKKIHSLRIPMPDYANNLEIDDVKVLHYAWLQFDRFRARQRYYSVLENVMCTSPRFMTRRRVYGSNRDWLEGKALDAVPPSWFASWAELGLDMNLRVHQEYYWHDYEILKMFAKYGAKKFWLDDIWDIDWEKCRQYHIGIASNNAPDGGIEAPPLLLQRLLSRVDPAYVKVLNYLQRVRQ